MYKRKWALQVTTTHIYLLSLSIEQWSLMWEIVFRYAERFKPISYNNQNEVVFYLKVLHDCATFNLSHFNLLFRALEKTYISEFQSSSLLIRGTGESSTLATGGSNPISSTTKILGILSDPFFVGESNHFHFRMSFFSLVLSFILCDQNFLNVFFWFVSWNDSPWNEWKYTSFFEFPSLFQKCWYHTFRLWFKM